MSRSIDYKITPLSVSGFTGFYKVTEEDAVEAYKQYLDQNTTGQHYDGKTKEEWFTEAINEYIVHLIAKRRREWEATDTSNDDAQGRAWAK